MRSSNNIILNIPLKLFHCSFWEKIFHRTVSFQFSLKFPISPYWASGKKKFFPQVPIFLLDPHIFRALLILVKIRKLEKPFALNVAPYSQSWDLPNSSGVDAEPAEGVRGRGEKRRLLHSFQACCLTKPALWLGGEREVEKLPAIHLSLSIQGHWWN